MPTIYNHQALIQAVLLAADAENEAYFIHLWEELDEDNTSQNSSSSSSSSSSDSDSSDGMVVDKDPVSSDDEDTIHTKCMSDIANLLKAITETHVINPHKVAKCLQLYLVLVYFKKDDPKQFCQNLLVSPGTFDELVTRIEDCAIFCTGAYTGRAPVEIQLAVALYRFGHDGNAASVKEIA